jgi:alkylresorcinol/alkylpyrone synthase/polyketide synthase Type III
MQTVYRPRIKGVGTSAPSTSFTQRELLELFQVRDRRISSLFLSGGIEKRHLGLTIDSAIPYPQESQAELSQRHHALSVKLGIEAVHKCLADAEARSSEIAYLCCVTTTGFSAPGISALLFSGLALAQNCTRLDVVGMGCNAGLNALNAAASWSIANPGKTAIVLCVEICSAAYVWDGSMTTAVVNSLFGDGAAAVALTCSEDEGSASSPQILKFESYFIKNSLEAMYFRWSETHGKYNFSLSQDVPYEIGAHIAEVITALLRGTGLTRADIKHWIVHSGGKKVLDAITVNLGLSRHDLRHTRNVLRDYGNVSSGSFLFSYERLRNEGLALPGDFGVMITMGPGVTIESALLRW